MREGDTEIDTDREDTTTAQREDSHVAMESETRALHLQARNAENCQ